MGEKEYKLNVVVKRDGEEVAADVHSIEMAISNAASESGELLDAEVLADKVMGKFKGDSATVEEVQDQVVRTLMTSKFKKTAECYVAYRTRRDMVREMKEDLFVDIDSLINQNGAELLTENANRDARIIPTVKSLVAESVGKHYARKYMLPKEVIEAHDSGDIHVHDLGEFLYPMFNCMLIDLETMLKGGFSMGNAKVESPSNILTACSVAAQVVTAVGSHIYGGNTLPNLDKTFKPYVEKTYNKHYEFAVENEEVFGIKDKDAYAKLMTKTDCVNGIQSLYYQVNTIVSSQGQTVFCTFTCGDGVSWEERLIQECILRQQMEGLGKEKSTFVFPKLVFQVRKGVNFEEDSPNYDMFQLASECSSKRLYPDALFMDTLQEKVGTQALPMG